MLAVIYLILLIAGAVCFALAVKPATARVNLVALGLFCWVLVPLIHAAKAVH
jgi:hypothetical protein